MGNMPLPSVNKAAHSDFETQRRYHQKSKTGVSVAAQKSLKFSKDFWKKKNKKKKAKTITHGNFMYLP